jgi:hypothetical protein
MHKNITGRTVSICTKVSVHNLAAIPSSVQYSKPIFFSRFNKGVSGAMSSKTNLSLRWNFSGRKFFEMIKFFEK